MPEYEMNWKEEVSFYGSVFAESREEAIEKVRNGEVIDPGTDPDSKMIKKSVECAGEI